MNALRIVALCVASASAAVAQGAAPAGDVLMRAMRDEMARSIQQLRLDTLPKPYFIAYRVSESEGVTTSANLGSIVSTSDGRGNRFLQVEVRVGDYAFDNTNYFGAGFMPSPEGLTLVANPLRPIAVDPFRASSWALMLGDLEVF